MSYCSDCLQALKSTRIVTEHTLPVCNHCAIKTWLYVEMVLSQSQLLHASGIYKEGVINAYAGIDKLGASCCMPPHLSLKVSFLNRLQRNHASKSLMLLDCFGDQKPSLLSLLVYVTFCYMHTHTHTPQTCGHIPSQKARATTQRQANAHGQRCL